MKVKDFPSKYNLKYFEPDRLKQAINYRAISKKKLAFKSNISVPKLNSILNGRIKDLEIVFKFSDILNFPVSFFFKPMIKDPEGNNNILFIN